MTNKMNHPLNDDIIEKYQLLDDLRLAYDLGYKSGYEKGLEDEAWAQVEREAGESL